MRGGGGGGGGGEGGRGGWWMEYGTAVHVHALMV